MKKFMKSFALLAVAALGLSACNDDKLVPDNGNADGKFVTVHFGAEAAIEGATKAALTTEDEKTFKSAWENGDVLSVEYSNDNTPVNKGIVPATWTADHFDATLPTYKGMWDYNVVYPAPDAESKVDFGSARTQKGNAYNSKYDLMKGSAIVENADAGKTDAGKNIVFNMTRQTAIAYFHLTSTLDEEVVSAKLSVEGGNIASSLVKLLDHTDGFDLSTEYLNEITITFEEGTAPKASNFQLWYNVLPTKYTKMTLTVETATKTFTISNTKGGSYTAGKLYKVKKENISWAGEGGSDTPSTVTDVITADKLKATSTTYTDFSGVQISSNAVYAGNNAKTSDGAIQLRSDKSTAGIVTTTSGGKVTKVSIEWASNTTNGRVINVYGNTNPYTSASELYSTTGNTNQGTNLGTIVCGTSTELVINGNYPYIGIRSNGGALYLNSVSITWKSDSSEPAPDTYSVSFASVTGGTLSASPIKAEAGAEITLTATPAEGYAFNNDWSVKGADESVIEVVDGKFTMPAQNVTVSGTFVEAAAVPVYASVAELIAAGKPTETATKVTVTLKDEEIIRFHTLKDGTVAGAIIKVGTQEVEIFCKGTPSEWKVGGTISGTLKNCDWKLYKSTWKLCPADYSELTYKAPLPTCATPVITIAEDGVVSITCNTAGATIHYTVGDAPADPTEANAVFSAVTLTDGQTIKAIAVAEGYKPSAVASKKYTVGGATGLVEYVSTFTDQDLSTKEKTMTWTSSLKANSFESANSSRGVQFGAAKGKFTITGTGHASKVKKISVIISTNNTGNTISATVGGVAIGKPISLKKDNNYEIVFESTTELSGDIVFNVNNTAKSVYIKSITVNPAN